MSFFGLIICQFSGYASGDRSWPVPLF